MIVKVFIRRNIPPGKVPELAPLMKQLRMLAISQHGYISGETLKDVDTHQDYITISTWHSMSDWKNFEKMAERKALVDKIETILSQKSQYIAYSY
ncbi:MAG: antibiotic biosynthesis monooxygenase [SAR324 cluster bacterium]|nr:antibiotic biosynthesis monooxygenase [SAR324 cluster bacterium]